MYNTSTLYILLCKVFALLFLLSCQHSKLDKTKFKEDEKNWEYLYSLELKSALENEDDAAFHFFWPYYLQERYNNKLKNAGNEILE